MCDKNLIRIYYLGDPYLIDYVLQLPGISSFYQMYLETYLNPNLTRELPFFQHLPVLQNDPGCTQLHFLNAVTNPQIFASHSFHTYDSAFDPFYVALFTDWQSSDVIHTYGTIVRKKRTSIKSMNNSVLIFMKGADVEGRKDYIIRRLNKIDPNYKIFELPEFVDVSYYVSILIDFFYKSGKSYYHSSYESVQPLNF